MQAKLLVINPKTSTKQFVDDLLIDLIKEKESSEVNFYLNKIKTNNYLDLKKFDGATIKKQEVKEVLNQFLFEGIERVNIKILFIENIDKSSKYIINSLLKFIEEIPTNTYVIFSTKNKSDVIETIISRCEIVYLKPDYNLVNETTKFLEDMNFSDKEISILIEEIDKTRLMLEKNELEVVNQIKIGILNFKNNFEYEYIKNDLKNLNSNQIEILLKLLFMNTNLVNIQKEILDLLRMNEVQINKNGLLTILLNLFI